MGYRRGSIYYFNTSTDTGINEVPVGYQVVVRDTGDSYLLNDKTGITAGSTVQDAATGGLFTTVSDPDTVVAPGGVLPVLDGSNLTGVSSVDDVTYENLSANGDIGTAATQVAQGNHTHSDVYEPADSTILKDADIGITVLAPNGDGSGLTGISTVTTIDDLTDVDITDVQEGDGLVWDGTKFIATGVVQPPPVYGLNWDQTNDTYVRTGDAVSWTPFTQFDTAPGNIEGTKGVQGLDDFSVNETVHKYMRRCVLNTDGTVNYYLDANDSTKKEDGVTPSVLDGTDGNVMVEIPKFYYKYNYNTTSGVVHEHTVSLLEIDGGTVHPAFIQNGVEKDYRYAPAYQGSDVGGKLMSVSGAYVKTDLTRDGFRTMAEANGAGWHVYDWLLYEATVLLMMIEYGSLNLQSAFGEGRTCLTGGTWANSSYYGIHGNSNSDGNFSNNNQEGADSVTKVDADNAEADLVYMTYRGIENLWGNVYLFLDGINLWENVPYINDNPATFADDVETGDYVSAGITMTASDGYSSELANSNKGFFPTAVAGSNSTHTGDYFYANDAGEHGVVIVGASATYGLSYGPLRLRGDLVASYSYVDLGAAISF